MKKLFWLALLAYFHVIYAFMTVREFENSKLLRCYDTNMQDNRRTSLRNINGQTLPLPNSIETFISIIERYESLKPNDQVRDLIGKLLKSFRIDDLHPEVDEERKLRDTGASFQNRLKRAIFSIPETISYEFSEDDFTDDEECALHFMLSHTVNDTRAEDTDEVLDDTNKVKQPREFGVVSLHSKRKHAFALGRVLLGMYAAYLPSTSEEITSLLLKSGIKRNDESVRNTKVNLVYAVTIGDLITRLVLKDEMKILGNGEWTDVSCPTEYRLDDNNGGFVTYSELRGAVDGLILGRKLQEYRQDYSNFRLSQILRQYYGYTGLVDTERTRWCSRDRNFEGVPDMENEMLNFHKLYRAASETGSVGPKTVAKINNAISEVRNNIFNNVEKDECSISDLSTDRKYVSPRNIFAILDLSGTASSKLNFQAEVIGNLSSDFDLRPRGNLMGVYTNLKALQQNTLDIIVKNSGIAGCPSCFAKYYSRGGNKEDEAELLKDLYDTLATFDQEQEKLEESYQSTTKAGSPGKVVLLFNFGTPNVDYRIRNALYELHRTYGEITILAIGDSRENLVEFVDNDQTDIFTSSMKTIQDIKQRINKIPGEFTYRACNQSNPAKEADNRQEVYIPPNKIQYWAMYPKYFLKSYGITMKFKPQDGASIRVCFTRLYSSLLEGKNEYCKDSTGGEIEFYTSNPCYKKTVFNCDPFYFSVEAKKQATVNCQSLRCSTPQDLHFYFEHEGIQCNIASYVSVSTIALLFAAVMYYLQKQ